MKMYFGCLISMQLLLTSITEETAKSVAVLMRGLSHVRSNIWSAYVTLSSVAQPEWKVQTPGYHGYISSTQ